MSEGHETVIQSLRVIEQYEWRNDKKKLMNELVKKVSLSGLMVVTVVAMTFGLFVPNQAKALVTGDLVKGPTAAVYYIHGTMKHVFPDAKTYFTWYSNFDAVKTVTVSELDMFTDGSPVAYRAGTRLVKTPDSAKVYGVEPGGTIRMIPDEATALALYGSNWAQWINDVHPLTFGSTYSVGSNLTSTMHPKGTLLQKTGEATIYYFDGTNTRPFASGAAFDANMLDFDYVVQVSSLANYAPGSSITGAESFATIGGSGTGSGPVGPAGTLTVSLSPTTPSANTVLLGGAARVPMVTVRLSAGNTAVIVDSLVIERKGIASDAAFSSFDLLDGGTMLPLNDSSKTLNSGHQATFNDDFTVPANGSIDVIVAANLPGALTVAVGGCPIGASGLCPYAGEYPAVAVTGMTLKNNSTMSGTLPVVGNVMLTNGTLTVGTAVVANGSNLVSAATKQVGTKDVVASSVKVSNTSSATGQNMTLKSVTFTNNGSTSASDVSNLRLVNSNTGVTLATLATVTSDKVSFNNLNLQILKGNNVNLDLKLDIVGGSGRNISYDIEKQGDIVVFDELRGFNALPTYTNTSEPYYDTAILTVDNGKFRVENVAVTPTNVQENKNGVLVGKYKFVVEGEPINVTRLPIKFLLNTSTVGARISDITNVTLKDAAGLAVISGIDVTSNKTPDGSTPDEFGTATSTDSFTLPIGETIYSVYADLSADFSANDTIQTQINPSMITAKGDVTGDTLSSTDITPTVDVSGSILSIRTADLNVTVSSAPAAQTVVKGASDIEVANIVLDAATSGSSVRVTQFKVPVITTGAAFPDIITGFELFVGGVKVPVESSSTAYSTLGSTPTGSATTTLTIASGNLTIPAGQTKTVVVKGDVGTGADTGSFKVGMQATGISAVDSEGNSFDADITAGQGQPMSLSTGGTLDLTLAQDPKAALAVGNTTVNVGQFSLQSRYENISLNAFGFSIGDPDTGSYDMGNDYNVVESLELWESGGSSAVGTISVSGANATVTPMVNGVATPVSLAANAMKTYIVKAKFRDVSVPSSISESSAGMRVTLRWVDADGQSAGSSSLTEPTYNTAFNSFSAYKSVPTFSLGSITADQATAVGNEVDLYKFSITANSAGPIGLAKFSFSVSTSTSVRMSTTGYALYMGTSAGDTSSVIAGSSDIAVVLGGGNAGSTVHDLAVKFDYNNDSSNTQTGAGTGELIEISAGTTRYFTLRGTIAALSATANDDSITTRMGGDAGFASTARVNVGGIDGAVAHDDFIWSDLNFVSGYNSSTATYTIGWFNGYRVSGLDDNTTTPQTQTD